MAWARRRYSRALRGEAFDTQESSTHGIDIGTLEMEHPEELGITMQLNSWDFGGQEIYHATHQFFLSNRSLYLLVWNARHGFEQGKLFYWLDMIQAKAPESPVIIVAAHTDQRIPDLPIAELRRRYTNIIGDCAVSNKDGTGIEELREKIRTGAGGLPLMGESWPTSWVESAKAVRKRAEKYIAPEELHTIMEAHNVKTSDGQILAQWLHDLGDVLYFSENAELKDIVILDPQWVTNHISRVLDSEQVEKGLGVFRREHMDTLWRDLDYPMRDYFLRLMEQFDLSYRTLDDRDISIVVERLSHNPPGFEDRWEGIRISASCKEVSMKFDLNTTLPPGIPTWFIARSHRFTTGNHWRYGALLENNREPKHLALVEASPNDRVLRLTVRGPYPYQFFYVLREGLENTLDRYRGLRIGRKVPCPGHGGETCSHEFDLDDLTRATEKNVPELQCPKGYEMVPIPKLLFGIHWETTQADVMSQLATIETKQDQTLDSIGELRKSIELSHLQFLNEFRDVQRKEESRCPNVFLLIPGQGSSWRQKLLGQKINLQLLCQAPGEWHPAAQHGLYPISEPPKWFKAVAPYLQRLIPVLRATVPIVVPFAGLAIPNFDASTFKKQLDLTAQLVDRLPEFVTQLSRSDRPNYAQLRAVRSFLEELDPGKIWGDLQPVPTPEGHYLWLCDYHASEYRQ